MEKRAQVTLFVIIAIVIIAGIIAFFLFRGRAVSPIAIPPELSPITTQIQDCVQATLEDGTIFVGLQGGYIIPPSSALETDFSYIAYGYYLGTNTLASKTKIGSEIATYIELVLPSCFDDSAFPEYLISPGNVVASASISDNYVSASVEYPLTIKKGQQSWKVDKKYTSIYKVNLGDMYNVVQDIIAKETQNPNSIDFTYLGNFDYDISVLHEGDDILVYSITDYALNETGGEYTFRFANKIR